MQINWEDDQELQEVLGGMEPAGPTLSLAWFTLTNFLPKLKQKCSIIGCEL